MQLRDLSGQKRREEIDRALDWTLADLTAPAATVDIVNMIAKRLETDGQDERRLIAARLMERAPGHPQAVRGSESYVRYGRTMRPWRWVPRVPTAAQPYIHTRLHEVPKTEREAVLAELVDSPDALRLAVLNPTWNAARARAEATAAGFTKSSFDPSYTDDDNDDWTVNPDGTED